jgi:outer membrane protein TolC
MANAEPNVYSAENSLYLAQWRLKALLALDLDQQIECEGRLTDYISQLEVTYPSDSLSLSGNSDMKILENQRKQLERNLQMQKNACLPTLNLSFSYSYNVMADTFVFDSWNPYSVLGFTLSIPIFSGGQRKSAVKEAEIDIKNASLQIEDTERSLKLSMMQYLNTMLTSAKQYQAARSGIDEAEKGYDIAVKRYHAGSGTLLEINNSQLALTQAQLNVCQSIYNWLTAKTSLEKIEGQFITE